MAVWIPNFGLPGSIRSEKGKEFEDQVWQALCDQTMNWKPHAKYPTLSMTEEFIDYLDILVQGGLLMYRPLLLGVASFAYNCKVCLDLGQTPFEKAHGCPVRLPMGL